MHLLGSVHLDGLNPAQFVPGGFSIRDDRRSSCTPGSVRAFHRSRVPRSTSLDIHSACSMPEMALVSIGPPR